MIRGTGVGATRSDRFLVIASGSKITTEIRVLDAFPMTHHIECLALLTPATR